MRRAASTQLPQEPERLYDSLAASLRTHEIDALGRLHRSWNEQETVFAANRIFVRAGVDRTDEENLTAMDGCHYADDFDMGANRNRDAVLTVEGIGPQMAINRAFRRYNDHVTTGDMSRHQCFDRRYITFQCNFLAHLIQRTGNPIVGNSCGLRAHAYH